MNRRCAVTILLLLPILSTTALAQIPPNQLSLGAGVLGDRQTGQHASAALLFSFAYADSPYRFSFVWEGEVGAMSDAESCQARDAQLADSPYCMDADILIGTRFHFFRRPGRRVLPFVNGLLGGYWTGSGAEDREYQSHLALQAGGGIDLRRAGSVHGLRLSIDYRRVFVFPADRNQLRFVTSYVLGPPEPPSPPAVPRVPRLALAQQPEIAAAVAFTEGPTVDRDGNVYFTEMVSLRIMKLTTKGVLSTFREGSNNANGLLIDPEGRLVACEGAGSERTGVFVRFKPQITRTDLRTGKMEVLADNYQGKPFVGPNDVTIDGKGRLYFTDLPGGAVYRIDGPGQVARILASPEIQQPNGIQISPDDKQLYLIESNRAEGGARMIRAYDLHADGSVANMRVHYNFYPGRSADGMSIDTEGNLYASAGMNQLRGSSETLDTKTGVYVISPEGKLLKFIPVNEDFITNNAFGGPDMKTLYVTAGKTLYKLRTEIAGLPR